MVTTEELEGISRAMAEIVARLTGEIAALRQQLDADVIAVERIVADLQTQVAALKPPDG
jgi:hypothetical protein